MSTPKVKPIPEGMHSLTPHLICADAVAAIAFYKKAFNATGDGFLPGPDDNTGLSLELRWMSAVK